MKYKISFENEEKDFLCRDDESISHAMMRIDNKHPIVGCRGGGCGICKIEILNGEYTLGRMSKAVVSDYEIGKGYALACRTYPNSDLVVKFIGKN